MMRHLLGRLSAPVVVLAGVLSAVFPAKAELGVNPIVAELTGANAYRKDVQVSNTSEDETIFVQVTVFEVTYPGAPGEKWIERKSPDESGLLAAPGQLVLAPGQTRIVRLVSVTPPARTDRIYRVEIKPVVGDIAASQSMIKVVVGYNVLVMARPDGARTEIVAERLGDTVVLRNVGNSAGFLFDGKACGSQGKPCDDLPPARMYAGNELKLRLRQGQDRIIYKLETGEKIAELSF